MDPEVLAKAHGRIALEARHPDWDTVFSWHRDEADPAKAEAAFRAILNEIYDPWWVHRDVPPCDLPDFHPGDCWFESGSDDD